MIYTWARSAYCGEMISGIPTMETLYESSKSYSRSALKVFGTDQRERFPFYAATALEHITKASLMKQKPLLLVELKGTIVNEDSLLILAGIKAAGQSQLRTVSLSIALQRVRKLFVSPASKADLDKLIDLRNGHIHLAQLDSEDEKILVAFIQQVEGTIANLNMDQIAFWGDMKDLVDIAKAQNLANITRDVARKFAHSRELFQQRFLGTEPAIIEPLRKTRSIPEFDQEIANCPACNSFGIATGEHRIGGEVDGDGHGIEWVDFYAQGFKCPNCLFSLNSIAELLEAGMDDYWGSEMDPAEFYLAAPVDDEYSRHRDL